MYPKLLQNQEFFRGKNTFQVFCYLMLSADQEGKLTTGRNQIARKLKVSPSSVYACLKTLESLAAIRQKPSSNMTTIYVCNWDKYQHKPDTNLAETTHTYREIDSNNLVSKDTKSSQVPVGTVTAIYDLYVREFNAGARYKLSDSRKLKIRARLRDAGEDMLRRAISNTANSQWHRGDNDRGWTADLDYIIRSYEQVEKLANMHESGGKMPSFEEALNDL
jgi:hypothetical protein